MKTSIIIPAYKEAKRIAPFLKNMLSFCRKNLKDYEILIVNDGSPDNTAEVVNNIIKNDKHAKLIGYSKNRGKGGAVEYGVERAKGDKILFIDADGSINPDQIPKMLNLLDEYDAVAGDRNSKESKVKRNFIRGISSLGFNSIVSLLFQYSYRDNLCGFKGFRKNVAKDIFKNLIDKRWVFDVELFYKIKKNKYSLYFMPIKWEHRAGSRVNMLKDPVIWFFRLFKLRAKLMKNG